jgi:hypothetical protein
MLAVVVLAGLLPDTGVVNASSSCTYGKCPAAQPFPLWAVGASIAVVVLALILALLLLRRSRRRPPTGGASTPATGEGTAAGEGATWSESTTGGSQSWTEGDENPPAEDTGAETGDDAST